MTFVSRIIDSLTVKFNRAGYRQITSPVFFNGPVVQMNYVIQLKKGKMLLEDDARQVDVNSYVLIPAQKNFYIKYGEGSNHTLMGLNEVSDNPEKIEQFLKPVNSAETESADIEFLNFVGFDVLLYNAISLFTILDFPVFRIPNDEKFAYLIDHICEENESEKLGKKRMIENYVNELVTHLCRYIKAQPRLTHYFDKLEQLSDPRLIDTIMYIQSNLDKDLSNKAIAGIAFVSEDYVGQFFKSQVNINLQDYIENQRLEFAIKLLRTQPDTIQEIAHKVGFKDAAYFSRRFKLKYGFNANVVRGDKSYVV